MRRCTSGRSGATSQLATMWSSASARHATPRWGSNVAGAKIASSAARPAAERVVSSPSACMVCSRPKSRPSVVPSPAAKRSTTRSTVSGPTDTRALHSKERPSHFSSAEKGSQKPALMRPRIAKCTPVSGAP